MTHVLPEMPCQEFVERVTDYLEGTLAGDDLSRLEAHLAACAHCAHYLTQLQITRDLTGRLSAGDVTPEMRGDLLEAFTRWREEREDHG